MGKGVPFEGANTVYNPPEGVPEDVCSKIHVFRNGRDIVTCWELSAEELADVIRTKRIWFTMQSGKTLFPHFIGSERTVHMLVADSGQVWKLSESGKGPRLDPRDGCAICDHGEMIPRSETLKCERPGCPYPKTPQIITSCSICGKPQFETTAGITCENGHGGAAPL